MRSRRPCLSLVGSSAASDSELYTFSKYFDPISVLCFALHFVKNRTGHWRRRRKKVNKEKVPEAQSLAESSLRRPRTTFICFFKGVQ